jgi:hypothetical protein
MNIIKWIKLEWYIPQRNKAKAKVDGHRHIAQYYEEKPLHKRSSRINATIEYNYAMASIWQEKLEKFEAKITKINNSDLEDLR